MQLQRQDLAGKTALITGASRGIGRAIAENLLMRGCNVLGTCASETSLSLIEDLRDKVNAIFQAKGYNCPTVAGVIVSLYDRNAHSLIADEIARLYGSKISIFISNAAAVERTPVGSLEPERITNMCLGNIQTPSMIIDELVKRRYFQPRSRIIFISSAETSRCDPEA